MKFSLTTLSPFRQLQKIFEILLRYNQICTIIQIVPSTQVQMSWISLTALPFHFNHSCAFVLPLCKMLLIFSQLCTFSRDLGNKANKLSKENNVEWHFSDIQVFTKWDFSFTYYILNSRFLCLLVPFSFSLIFCNN